MLDLTQDASLYNTQIRTTLMQYNPSYNNSMPYGNATPNRAGLLFELTQADEADRWSVKGGYRMTQEVVGTGSVNKKNFSKLYIDGVLRVDKFMESLDNTLELYVGFWSESTTRSKAASADSTIFNVDLANSSINAGLTFEFVKDVELLGAFRQLTSRGLDYISERNSLGEVVDFSVYDVNLSETMVGGGINYVISEKINLAFLYHVYTWKQSKSPNPSYSIGQGSINYVMRF
jgi:hypothetical protein